MSSSDSTRRQFITSMGALGLGIPLAVAASRTVAQDSSGSSDKLIDSPPVLQCPSDNAVNVVWAVKASATGQVEFGTDPNQLDQTAYGDVFGMKPYHDRFLQVRIDGLKPNTTYYYRTSTCAMTVHRYNKFDRGPWIHSDVYSFQTPGPNAPSATFSVINDTHNKAPVLKMLMDRLAEIKADYTVWNGDQVDQFQDPEMAISAILHPAGAAFATERPMLFVPGNHECRGRWARNLPQAVPTWPIDNPKDLRLGRNFVVRKGPLAIVGLDTGEDKPDDHPEYGGLNFFDPYRIAQEDWLKRALNSPAVKTAPFVVAFCHIPLFNPGPDETPEKIAKSGGGYQRDGLRLWGPLLEEHGVQLLVCAHHHRFRYDAPSEKRSWAQLLGGGCDPKNGPVTIIRGNVDENKMEIVVEELVKKKELGRWTYQKRT